MATLKSETGNDGFNFFWIGLYVIVGLWVGMVALDELAQFLGTELPISDTPWLRLVGRLFFGAIGFVVLHLIGSALLTFAQILLQQLVSCIENTIAAGERLGAAAADLAVQGLVLLAKLALFPVTAPVRVFHARVIAPWQERRRQMAQMRFLYSCMKDRYESFEDFVRDFNGEAKEDADKQDDVRKEDVRKDKKAAPDPVDPFAEAIALFGLAADGFFTKAEFKAAYRKRMKEAHPDVSGDVKLATKLNAARDLINARKGWKR